MRHHTPSEDTPQLVAEMFREFTRITHPTQGTKDISTESFLEELTKCLEEKGIGTKTSKEAAVPCLRLPPNVYLFSQTATVMKIGMYFPAVKVNLTFSKGRAEKDTILNGVQLPNIIISIGLKKAKKWGVTAARYWATNRDVASLPDKLVVGSSPSTGIWPLPLPNMYNGGDMCFGGNSMPNTFNTDLRELGYYYEVLANSPYNNDLAVPGVSEGRVEKHPKYSSNSSFPLAWISLLTKCDSFPYELLREYSEDTEGDAIEGDAIEGDAIEGDAIEGDAIEGDAIEGDATEEDTVVRVDVGTTARTERATIFEGIAVATAQLSQ